MPTMQNPDVALRKIRSEVRENTSARETITEVHLVSRRWPSKFEFRFRSGEELKWCVDEIKMILRNLRLKFDNASFTFGKAPRSIQVDVLL